MWHLVLASILHDFRRYSASILPVYDLRGVIGDEMSIVVLTWTFPGLRADGTAIDPSEVLTAFIYEGASASGVGGPVTGSPNGRGTFQFTASAGQIGQQYNYWLTVADSLGNVSAHSNTASVTIPAPNRNPAAVTDLVATVRS
jgi:hypothetical protein